MPVRAKFPAPVLPGLGPNQPPAKWVPDPFPHVVEQPRLGVDHPLPSSAEDKERVELYLYSPPVPSLQVKVKSITIQLNCKLCKYRAI